MQTWQPQERQQSANYGCQPVPTQVMAMMLGIQPLQSQIKIARQSTREPHLLYVCPDRKCYLAS